MDPGHSHDRVIERFHVPIQEGGFTMLREPRKAEKAVQIRKDKRTGRFRIEKLEERIAPRHCEHGQGKKCR